MKRPPPLPVCLPRSDIMSDNVIATRRTVSLVWARACMATPEAAPADDFRNDRRCSGLRQYRSDSVS
jgi:hypothetical protein